MKTVRAFRRDPAEPQSRLVQVLLGSTSVIGRSALPWASGAGFGSCRDSILISLIGNVCAVLVVILAIDVEIMDLTEGSVANVSDHEWNVTTRRCADSQVRFCT